VGRVVLEDDVQIGSHVSIDRATFGETKISAGAKLDNKFKLATIAVSAETPS
jgi:UDP-3-O-[3-hydroxymyristoyl] glucosamine N-acyltransferase